MCKKFAQEEKGMELAGPYKKAGGGRRDRDRATEMEEEDINLTNCVCSSAQ